MTEGQYIYHVALRLLSGELYIKREVLLSWDPQADRYTVGDSREPSSRTETGFVSRGLGLRRSTPTAAVNVFLMREIRDKKGDIATALAHIKQAKTELKRLKKLDASKLKVEGKPDNWTPCDY
jgi:hypothetical protein